MSGRSRKRKPWVEYVHSYVLTEFEKLQAIVCKIVWKVLLLISVTSMEREVSEYSHEALNTETEQPIINIINM